MQNYLRGSSSLSDKDSSVFCYLLIMLGFFVFMFMSVSMWGMEAGDKTDDHAVLHYDDISLSFLF